MTREELEGFGLTDRELTRSLREALVDRFDRRVTVSEIKGDEEEDQWQRASMFQELTRLWYSSPGLS